MGHLHDKIDFVVNAFVVYQDRVLLINHKKLNMWLPVGGHIELDEDPEEAVRREVKEESGLQIKILGSKPALKEAGLHTKSLFVPSYMDIHDYDDNHRHIAFHYFAVTQTDKVKLAKGEHNSIRWFKQSELGDPKWGILPAIQFYAKQALKAAN